MNYRLIHSETEVIALVEDVGTTNTPHTIYTGSLSECQAEVARLGLTDPNGAMPQSTIAKGEQHVEASGLTATRLVTLMDLLMQVKGSVALASHPKLVALYAWLQTVKAMAVAGAEAFPPAPFTFEQVVAE